MTKKNLILLILLTIYTLFGVWLSINTGISHDAYHEQKNWLINVEGIKLFFTTGEYQNLIDYRDKYHGIGFHLFSQPIQFAFVSLTEMVSGANFYGSYLIAKNAAVFIIFSISAIFFYLLAKKISKSFNFALISTIIYIFYPSLFGHAQINPKDVPFLSVWLINSYLFLSLIHI